MSQRKLICLVILSIAFAMLPRLGFAQWKQIALLPTAANTIIFLDKQGTPKIGFAGCHSDIMRTTDGGITWKSVQTTFGAYVRDFVFFDSLNGIAVCSAAPLFFRTTNAGVTWELGSSPGGATSISFVKSTGVLTVNSIHTYGPSKFSLDTGVTWQVSPVPEEQNGMIFSGDLNGIFAAHNTGKPLYYTVDGAKSWTPTSFYEHVYSPVALDDVPATFLTVGELSAQCWISSDSGKTWKQRTSLPVGVLPTGCTRYYHGNIWVQTQANGFFLSTDQGSTWRPICGPSRLPDTRFYSIDSTLFACDEQGNLWKIDDGRVTAVASETAFLPCPIRVSASTCFSGSATFAVITTSCYEQLDTIKITGSPRIRMIPGGINRPMPIPGQFSVTLQYTPIPNTYFDTAWVHVIWGSNPMHDTIIPVYAAVATGALGTSLTFNSLPHSSCDAFDTVFALRTKSCDTAQVLDCKLIDSSEFRLFSLPPFPFKLYPGHNFQFGVHARSLPAGTHTASVRFRIIGMNGTVDTTFAITLLVSGAPSPIAGPARVDPAVLCDVPDTVMWIHNPYCGAITLERAKSLSSPLTVRDSVFPLTIRANDSIALHLHAEPVEGHYVWLLYCQFHVAGQTIDTILYVLSDGRVLHLAAPKFSATARTICDIVDTIVWIYAPKCLGTRIDWLHLDHPRMQLLDTAFPVTLNAGDSMPVHLRIVPSNKPITGTLGAQFVEDSVTLDTTYALTVGVKSTTKPTPKISPNPLRFGLTPWCSGKALALNIFNNKCQALHIVRIAWVIADSQISYDSVPLPMTIAAGQLDSIIVRYKPAALRPTTATIRITFDLADLTQDTVITITGTGIDTGIALIEPTAIAYDTISKCSERIDTASFNNVSCDTMVIESFVDWEKNGYDVLSPSLPITVTPGGVVPIVVRLQRSSNGSANDSLDFAYHSNKPPFAPLSARLRLFGHIQTPIAAPQMSEIAFDSVTLAPCTGFDSFVIVRNTNVCDSVSITSLSGTGISSYIMLPFMLAPGEQDTVRFHYAPSRDTDITTLRIEGTSLDSSIRIRTFRPGAGSITCTPLSLPAFIAPLCQITMDSVLLGPGGCDSALLDRIAITPGSNFHFDHTYALPFELAKNTTLRIAYDPSLGGSDTALLYLHSTSGALDVRIPLRGLTTFHHTSRISVHNDTNTVVTNMAAGAHTNFTIYSDDEIPDSLALSEIDCELATNSNILTLSDVVPGPHLSVVSSSQQGNQTSVLLRRIDASALPAHAALATLRFSATVSDTIATDISLSDVRFNPNDPAYERCVLSPLIDNQHVTVLLDPSCNRDLLSRAMAGREMLTSIRVHPSLLASTDKLVLDLDAVRACSVHVRLINALGEESKLLDLNVAAGHSEWPLELGPLPSGIQFLDISTAGVRAVQRVLVLR